MDKLESIIKILEYVTQIVQAIAGMGVKVNGEIDLQTIINLFKK